MSHTPIVQEVSDRLQALQATPRSKSITSSASNMAASSDHMSSRAAIKNELFGRLRFNDEGVLRRLGTNRITEAFVQRCYSGFSNDPEHFKHFQELRDVVSTAEHNRGGNKNEQLMYSPLDYIFNYIASYDWDDTKGCSSGVSRHSYISFRHNLTSEVHTLGFLPLQPNLSILDPETPVITAGVEDGESRYFPQWHYRSAFVKVKVTRSQGPTSLSNETVTDIVQQAADYARLHMAACPFQLFSVCLLMYGLSFCVAIFDRGGVTFSPEGNLSTNDGWRLFVRIVRCLFVTMTDEDLGRDPTARPLTSAPVIDRLQEEARSLGITISKKMLII